MTVPESLVIIGGGISGLSAAFYAKRRRPDLEVTLVEANGRLGGVLQTVHRDGYLIEQSADSFLATDDLPWAKQLAVDLGLENQLIGIQAEARRALVLFRDRLHLVPRGFNLMAATQVGSVLGSSLLSWRGKLRLLQEARVAARLDPSREESLAEFAVRRVGQEAFERLVQPLTAGIYAADPTQLSVDAALPQFVAMERDHGSLSRALRLRNRHAGEVSGARYSKFLTLKDGLGQLVSRLTDRIHSLGVRVERDMAVDRIDCQPPGRWRVSARLKSQHADAVIVAVPPTSAAPMLQGLDSALSQRLTAIPSATLAIVCLAYDVKQLKRWPQASGFVVPEIEQSDLIAASFANRKFVSRAPPDGALVRVFLGGANHPEIVGLDDAALCIIAHTALKEVLGIKGAYHLSTVARWKDASPQYHLGHRSRVEAIDSQLRQHVRLAIAGNSYNGVGLPQCVHSALAALDQVGI